MGKTIAMLILIIVLLSGYWWLLHDVSKTVSNIQIQMEQRESTLMEKIK